MNKNLRCTTNRDYNDEYEELPDDPSTRRTKKPSDDGYGPTEEKPNRKTTPGSSPELPHVPTRRNDTNYEPPDTEYHESPEETPKRRTTNRSDDDRFDQQKKRKCLDRIKVEFFATLKKIRVHYFN